jgi:uncharacterized protein (TIGR02996 family)
MTTATAPDPMHAVFLDDIRAHPADDAPRLIYADWLQDHGEEERAEFIRVQCELAAIDHANRGPLGPVPRSSPWRQNEPRTRQLERREGELLLANEHWDSLPFPSFAENFHDGTIHPHSRMFSRGFVGAVVCPWEIWESHGPALVARHPIERVTLAGMRPRVSKFHDDIPHAREIEGKPFWEWDRKELPDGFSCGAGALPNVLMDLLPAKLAHRTSWYSCQYLTEQAALDALSAAAIAWARKEAGK